VPEEGLSADQQSLVDDLLADELALSRAISHVEDREAGYRDVVEALMEHTGSARTVGITGRAPGRVRSSTD
jgi:LAO/AO transport system kinase